MAAEQEAPQPRQDGSATALTILLCASAGTSIASFASAFAQDGNVFAHPCLLAFTLLHLALLGLAGRTLQRFVERRRKAEEMLRESERFSRSIVDALPMHIAILDG